MFWDLLKKGKNKEIKESDKITALFDWVKTLDGEVKFEFVRKAALPSYGSFGKLDPRVVEAVKSLGAGRLYSHQSRAVRLAKEGKDIVIVTPTASGKTLCYNLPVADAIVTDSNARALYLFPTKALAQDQLNGLAELSARLGGAIKSFAYDGDTKADKRALARSTGNVIITNPDMLSSGILPHHNAWAPFFGGLRYVVVDELHSYRGVFGSHLANLFVRLLRICDYYGSKPVFICCSATIENPAEHASALVGRKVFPITESGAPCSENRFMIYNPKLLDKRRGIRRSSLFESARIAAKALECGISTIVFTRSRLNVELLLKSLRATLRQQGTDPSLVAGYRGGYLPNERREIEQGLRSGKILGVVSTNALELGIDIGFLDLVVLHGYPDSVASAIQQAGRAGRRGGVSAAVMVASANSIDQFLAERPSWFLGASPELARIDPLNPYIQVGHIRCSAFELPFRRGEKFGGRNIEYVLDRLAEAGVLHLSGHGENESYYWQDASYPAAALSLRSATSDVYQIVDVSNEARPRLIGTMDKHSAPSLIFPGAIYFHAGQSYIVSELDTRHLRCFVKLTKADYYTEGDSSVNIAVTEEFERRGLLGWGECVVASRPTMFRKIKLKTHENVGNGTINLPEESMKTTAAWIQMPKAHKNDPQLISAMHGLVNLMRNALPLFLMCDGDDIQVTANAKSSYLDAPAVFVSDNIPGGVGLAEGTFEMGKRLPAELLEILGSCPCSDGCPVCTGAPSKNGGVKSVTKDLLRALAKEFRK